MRRLLILTAPSKVMIDRVGRNALSLSKEDNRRWLVEIQIKSSLSDAQKNEIWDNLRKQHISNVSADYFEIRHSPWCTVRLSIVIDIDKGVHAGQYSSKEDWEK